MRQVKGFYLLFDDLDRIFMVDIKRGAVANNDVLHVRTIL